MKKLIPIYATVDPDMEDMQSWAEENAHELHGVSVDAAYIMATTSLVDEVIIIHFAWEDEVYADLVLKRDECAEAVENALEYYVSIEFFEQAAYARDILNKLKTN